MPSNTTFSPENVSQFTNAGVHFDGQSVSGTVPASTTGNVDLKLNDDMFITGGILITKGAIFGDVVCLQIVDVDGIFAPAGMVLNQFCKWIMADDPPNSSSRQLQIEAQYPGKVYAGLYLRVAYTSTGPVDVLVAANYTLHKILL